MSDYRLLGASSFIFIFYLFIFLNKNHDNILELKKDKNAQNKLNAFCLLPIWKMKYKGNPYSNFLLKGGPDNILGFKKGKNGQNKWNT